MARIDIVGGSQRTGIELGGHHVVVVTPPAVYPMYAIGVLEAAVAQHGAAILTSAHFPPDPDGTPKRVQLIHDGSAVIAAVELA